MPDSAWESPSDLQSQIRPHRLVARSQGFSKAAFSGLLSDQFEHLAKRHIKLLDFDDHPKRIKNQNKRAISRTRYGYDDDDDEDLGDLVDFEDNLT